MREKTFYAQTFFIISFVYSLYFSSVNTSDSQIFHGSLLKSSYDNMIILFIISLQYFFLLPEFVKGIAVPM